MEVRFRDEFEHGFGWTPAEPELMERMSHAVLAGGRVWVTDALVGEGVEGRVRSLGDPAGVVQLIDRHKRDCAALAEQLGVPLHVTPFDGVPGAPFEAIPLLRRRYWRELALWFTAERTLVCGDALGSAAYFRAGGERLAVHPLLRVAPPRRPLGRLEPEHLLFGHGEGIHGPDAAPALREALATARRRLPRAWLAGLTAAARARRGR